MDENTSQGKAANLKSAPKQQANSQNQQQNPKAGGSQGDDGNGGNFTPIKKNNGGGFFAGQNKIVLGLILVLVITLPIIGYFVYNEYFTTSSEAQIPACHNGLPPLPIDPDCFGGNPECIGLYEEDPPQCEFTSCPAPSEGFCKEKGNCYECRFEGDNSLRFICPCGAEPTPTPPPQEGCPNTQQCVPVDQVKSTCGIDPTSNTAQRCAPSGQTAVDGLCCKPQEVVCESPKQCVDVTSGEFNCVEGSEDKIGTGACEAGKEICCVPQEPTATPEPTPTNTPTSTPPPNVTPTDTPTPSPTNACVLPKINVEVICETCGERVTQ